jgi:hypothetical protein
MEDLESRAVAHRNVGVQLEMKGHEYRQLARLAASDV